MLNWTKALVVSEWTNLIPTWENLLLDSPGLIAVDFDNTLVRGDFGEKVMQSLLQQGFPRLELGKIISYDKYFRNPLEAEKIHKDSIRNKTHEWYAFCMNEYTYQYEKFGLGPSYRWTAFIFSGWTKQDFLNYARKVWLDQLEKSKFDPNFVHPRKPLLDLLHTFQKKQWKVKIITASPTWAIQATTSELGLDLEDVYGMNLQLELNQTTDVIIEPYPYGEGKVTTLQKYFGKNPDIAFGDTINDLPMLKSARKAAVLFDRGNEELNQICRELKIHIHDWI